jgi:glycosyltransferase involved in cell wall biosynthesis
MKILFCIESLHAGGKERQLIELLTYLRAKGGYELFLVIMKEDIHFDKFISLKIPYKIIERKLSKKDPFIFAEFYKAYKKFQPDIIHSWGSMVTFYSLPAKILLKYKLLNFDIQDAPQRQIPVFSFRNIITKINFIFSDFIIANSLAGLRAYNVKSVNAKVIHNGIVLDRITQHSTKDKTRLKYNISTKYAVLMVASYSDFKKNKLFVEVANKVCEMRSDISFYSLGEGNKDLFNECKNNIKYNKNIVLLGRIKDVESLINVCDIGVLFTNGEGISNAIMEYMVFGKPVIAHGTGGTKELVKHKESGILLENESVDEIANLVIELVDNPARRMEMGLAGKKIIEENFTIDKMGLEFEKIYNMLYKKQII